MREPKVGQKGVRVISRDGKEKGLTTGATRCCRLGGCLGRALGVKWADGKTTYPCTKGMSVKRGAWKID
jgi:hypothetical protein